MRPIEKTIVLLLMGFIFMGSAFAVKIESLKNLHKDIDQKTAKIESVYLALEKLLANAKAEKKSFKVINCIIGKRDLVEGFYKASQRAKFTITDAYYQKDAAAIETYKKRSQEYVESSKELKGSIFECTGDQQFLLEAGFIEPKEQWELSEADLREEESPDEWHGLSGAEGFPIIIPISPFQ